MKKQLEISKALQGINLLMKKHHEISKALQGISLLMKKHHEISKAHQGTSLLMKKHHDISKALPGIRLFIKNCHGLLKSFPGSWAIHQEPAQFLDILHFDPCDCCNHRHWPQYIGRVVAPSWRERNPRLPSWWKVLSPWKRVWNCMIEGHLAPGWQGKTSQTGKLSVNESPI